MASGWPSSDDAARIIRDRAKVSIARMKAQGPSIPMVRDGGAEQTRVASPERWPRK